MRKILSIFCCFLMIFTFIACSKNKDDTMTTNETSTVRNVSIEETKELMGENKELTILDVRTKEEYEVGHLAGAILIPYDEIEMNINQIEQYRDKPILVYCRTGRRSSLAIEILVEHGFTNIYHMAEGISGWNYDIVK